MSLKRKMSFDDEAILPPPKKIFLTRFTASQIISNLAANLPTPSPVPAIISEKPRIAPRSDLERMVFDIRGTIYSNWYLEEFRCQPQSYDVNQLPLILLSKYAWI